MPNMAPTPEALAAHVLRRLTFGPTRDLVEQFAAAGPQAATAAIDWALTAEPLPIQPEKVSKDDWDPNLRGWVDNLRNANGGLHEKMTWFWHGHFATSGAKVSQQTVMHDQQRLLRQHALGNFREFLRAIMSDAAMLMYLDSAGSSVEAPNENLARESMELFALGRGNYTESDVKAGALALAGWNVDYDSAKVSFDPEAALGGEIVFLGRRGKLGVDEVVDTMCGQSSCATFITNKIYKHLVGVAATPDRLGLLADGFRSSNLEIRPLVEAIVRTDEFTSARMNRPKYPIEWFTGALHALTPFREGEDPDISPWSLEQLDQLPYQPPNVAGWPSGAKWLSASQQLTRASYAWAQSWKMEPIETGGTGGTGGTDLVAATLKRCCLHEVSAATRETLHDAALAKAGSADALSVSRRLITTALCSPEFALS
jgi:uncharacterized protein (DUF1800 family)